MLSSLHALPLSPLALVLQADCSVRYRDDTLKETGTAKRPATMGFPQKRPLCQLTSQEREELAKKATSLDERVSTVKRAKALLYSFREKMICSYETIGLLAHCIAQ
jgi:hypothetical protein